MNAKTREKYEARAKVIKAMAHPTRLFLVDELVANGDRCVCELTELVGADMSTVSRHLSILKEAGIVEDERHGTQIHYRLRARCILNFFTCIEAVMENDAKKRMKLVERCSK